MTTSIPHFGELLALITAIVWATATILFKKSGETVHPVALNLFKCLMGAILLPPTIWIFGDVVLRNATVGEYVLLLVSGALGIAVADTLFFMCLNLLGAGLSSIVTCLYSPFIIVLSVLYLNETLTLLQLGGVLLIVLAVLLATTGKSTHGLPTRKVVAGVFLGASSMAVNAIGVVMVKPLLDRSPLLWVSEIRMIGGAIALLLILALHRQKRSIVASVTTSKGWAYTVFGSFLGAYVALVLWLGGMKYTQASIASALNETSSVFVFVLAVLLLKERVTIQRTAGIGLAVAGVYLVTFG
jgi:drug/metabolite transporter (DMT)-like permease